MKKKFLLILPVIALLASCQPGETLSSVSSSYSSQDNSSQSSSSTPDSSLPSSSQASSQASSSAPDSSSSAPSSSSTPEPEPVVEKYIEVRSYPTKTVFTVGDYFTMDGLSIVKYTVTDGVQGNKVTVDPTEYTLSTPVGTLLSEEMDKLTVVLTMYEEGYNSLSFDFQVKAPEEYTVTFKNYDGTILESSSVVENRTASYSGATPTHPSDENYFYSFIGWYVEGDASQTLVDPSTYVVTGDVTFVAKFQASDSRYSADGLSYTLSQGNAILVDGSTAVGNVVIPDEVNGQPVTEIAEDAFNNNDEILSVEIGANVEQIDDTAFYGCDALTTLTFAEKSKLTSIGYQAFRGCKVLDNVVLPDSLKVLGEQVFHTCSSLKSLTLNEGLLEIGGSAFAGTIIQTFRLPDSVVTMGGTLFSNNKMITDVVLGKERKDIDPFAIFGNTPPASFTHWIVDEENPYLESVDGILYSEDRTTLYSVPRNLYTEQVEEGEDFTTFTIPDSVETIAPYAMTYCQNYTTIVFGANVKTVSSNAFRYANKVTQFQFNDSLTTIEDNAFYGCGALTSVVLPDSVISVGDYAFASCSKLESFTFGAGIQELGSFVFNNCSKLGQNIHFSEGSNLTLEGNAVYDKEKTKLFFYLDDGETDSYVLPDTVKEINGGVFYNNRTLTSIEIPATSQLEKIGDQAFRNMTNLACDLTFPETLKTIGATAFYGDAKITGVVLPTTLEVIGDQAFYNLKAAKMEKVVLSESIQSVGTSAFSGCANLQEVEVDTANLGTQVFQNATSLAKATLDQEVTAIPEACFRGCTSLSTLDVQGELTQVGEYALADTAIFAFDFSTLETIDGYAFEGTDLAEIEIPESVTTIGEYAFNEMENLTKATFHNSMEILPSHLLSNCTKLSEVHFDKAYLSIGNYAFQKCTALSAFSLPEGLLQIGDYAFDGCTSLAEAPLPESLLQIGNYAFQNCNLLSVEKLPAGLVSLGNYAFNGCKNVPTDFTLGSSLETIGNNVFQGTPIQNLVLQGAFDTKNAYAFQNMISLESIDFQGGLTEGKIPNYLFNGDTNLKSIQGLEDVEITQIGTYAFQNCSSLADLGFATNKVTTINSYAFEGMSSLTQFEFSTDEELSSLPSYCFQNTGLTSLDLPSNIQEVGQAAFAGCTGLTSVTIENPNIDIYRRSGTSSIYEKYKVFYNCGNLKDIYVKGTLEQAQTLFENYGEYGLSAGVCIHYLNEEGSFDETASFLLA